MGYPMELDEYTDEALVAELKRRHDRRLAGGCGYCKRTTDAHATTPCRFWATREAAKSAEALERIARQHHTDHCIARQAWGDGECECKSPAPDALAERDRWLALADKWQADPALDGNVAFEAGVMAVIGHVRAAAKALDAGRKP